MQARKSLAVATGRNSWATFGSVKSVHAVELRCTVTNMSFFDRIKDLEGTKIFAQIAS